MSESEDLRDILYNEMANLTIFMRLLKYAVARQKMIKCFSVSKIINSHWPIIYFYVNNDKFISKIGWHLLSKLQVLMCSGRQLSTEISSKFVMYTQHHFQPHYKTSPMKNSNHNLLISRDMCLKQIENGMRLGTFLTESGWLQDSLKVLVTIMNVINTLKLNYNTIIVKLDCLQRYLKMFIRNFPIKKNKMILFEKKFLSLPVYWFIVCIFFRLLHTQVAFCCFTDANKSQTEANEIIDKIGIEKVPINLLVTYYKVLSMLYFAKSDYNLSYDWSVKALELIGPSTPDKCV